MKSILFASCLFLVAVPLAGDECLAPTCPNCGCCELDSFCKMVPSKKKETKTIYCCKCDDVCLPGKSTKCGEQTVPDCEARKGYRCETIWQPSCGRIITKKLLMKKTITEEKEVCVCKVWKCCCNCGYEFDPAKPATTKPTPK